ncbi:hypothetical protein H310_12360 [Aphanomyces invadans]|uniref:Uncharacterized protein n=1 Tax=Aphanomyces invadans TaxID=157072 RepID=A0A024TKC8_9STRA|nr:hypothetical protein H310_12360 [Aphanomyces invadans]ETV93797.1 hypothetical protein H310_12360 [Aphanomyces invadans]|eukprot:XP_008877606.1 hypothetical protein H310_12360 [Aphanomyces invadans]
MNLIQGKTNQYLREAILENNVEKARKYLTLVIGKADVQATTEQGGFTMLHCAVIIGNVQMVVMLLQLHANIWAITDDGYSALDLAIWKGHGQIIDILRTQGAIAPMKEPESLNGKMVLHLGRKAVVVDYFPSTAFRTKSTRALHYPAAENGKTTAENYLVNLWAGTDYRIIGIELDYERHRSNVFTPMDISMDAEECHVLTDQRSRAGSEANSAPRTPVAASVVPGFPMDVETKLEAELENVLEGQAFFDEDDDDDTSEDDDDEIEVEATAEVVVPPGPLGVLLDSGIESCAVVQGFTPLVSGGPGAIEASGVVKPGMYIIGINETNACLMTLQQVIQLLGKLARKEKIIRFAAYKPPAPPKIKVEKVNAPRKSSASTASALPTSSNLADLVSAVRDRRASMTAAPISFKLQDVPISTMPPPAPTTPIVPTSTVGEAECAHCGLPSTVHCSNDCPYK